MKKKLRKRIWDIVFIVAIGLILFIPSIRMPVVSTIQRIFAGSPSPVKKEQIKAVKTYDWALVDLKGNPTNFSVSKGRVAIVNFWATWCPPCVAEMPSFQKLYDKFGDQVDFYFVSQEQTPIIERFLKEKKYHLPVYQPKTNLPKEFISDGLPTTFVLNKKGEVSIKEVGAKDWFSSGFQEQLKEMIYQGVVLLK